MNATDRTTTEGSNANQLTGLFELLRNQRRRRLILLVADRDGPITLREASREIAAIEWDKQPDDVWSNERKSVYVTLYQSHIDQLDDSGVINYENGDIKPTKITTAVAEYIHRGNDLMSSGSNQGGFLTGLTRGGR